MTFVRPAGLRARMLLLATGASIVFAALLAVALDALVENGYREIESREDAETHRRLRGLIEGRLLAVDMKAHDWAEWDEMADWLRQGATGSAPSSLTDSAMAILRERDHGFFRADGRLAAAFAFDPRDRSRQVADTGCLRRVLPEGGGASVGIFRCGDWLEIAAARPVHHTSVPGEHGWVVVGHRLDAAEEELLSGLLGRTVRVRLVDPRTPSPVVSDSLSTLSIDLPVRGSVLVARFEAQGGRSVHAVSMRVRGWMLGSLVALVLVGSVLSMWILDRFAVRRILRLSDAVAAFDGEGRAPAGEFGDGSRDELGTLGNAIDGLVARLGAVQERLAASLESAEAGNRAKSAFLASMSHDLRTPLNGMIGLTEFLAKTRLEPSQREAIDLLRGGSENLLAMINDILEFSRSEAGHEEILLVETATEDIFHQPVRILAPMAHRQGVDITVVFDPELPSRLLVDVDRVRQVLHNLVGNAVKFTEKGEVLVRVARTAQEGSRHLVRISVCDTGTGIPQESIDSIFSPFVQVAGEVDKRRGGTGLGLAISRRIVERMGGRLQVRSREGEGSEFFFEIALDAPERCGRLVPLEFPWKGCDPVAVLVRRASLRSSILDLFAAVGLDAIELLVPESAFAMPDHARTSLLVADVESLGEDDLRFLAVVRSAPGLATAPLVLLSRTDLLDDNGLRGIEGIQEVLRRPVPPSRLLAVLEEALRPRARVLAHLPNPFLRTLASGMLSHRGHRIADSDPGSVWEGEVPDVLLLDGEAPTSERVFEEAERLHPGVSVVQLGGRRVLSGAELLERPFSAERLCALVERCAHARRLVARTTASGESSSAAAFGPGGENA